MDTLELALAGAAAVAPRRAARAEVLLVLGGGGALGSALLAAALACGRFARVQALVARGDRVFVYTVEDNKAVMKPVKTGIRQAGLVQIVEGLAVGDTVITDGQIKLRPGAEVSIAQP